LDGEDQYDELDTPRDIQSGTTVGPAARFSAKDSLVHLQGKLSPSNDVQFHHAFQTKWIIISLLASLVSLAVAFTTLVLYVTGKSACECPDPAPTALAIGQGPSPVAPIRSEKDLNHLQAQIQSLHASIDEIYWNMTVETRRVLFLSVKISELQKNIKGLQEQGKLSTKDRSKLWSDVQENITDLQMNVDSVSLSLTLDVGQTRTELQDVERKLQDQIVNARRLTFHNVTSLSTALMESTLRCESQRNETERKIQIVQTTLKEEVKSRKEGERNITNLSNRLAKVEMLVSKIKPGSTPCYPAESCLQIKKLGNDCGDGTYYVNPSGKEVLQVYCDMTALGGGWTLILNQISSTYYRITDSTCLPLAGLHTAGTQCGMSSIFSLVSEIRYTDENGVPFLFAKLNGTEYWNAVTSG
jgi:hypothetical protein